VRLRLAFQYFGWKIRVMHPCASPPPAERAHPLNGIVVMQAANSMRLQLSSNQPTHAKSRLPDTTWCCRRRCSRARSSRCQSWPGYILPGLAASRCAAVRFRTLPPSTFDCVNHGALTYRRRPGRGTRCFPDHRAACHQPRIPQGRLLASEARPALPCVATCADSVYQ
jgi:hypothetical protein